MPDDATEGVPNTALGCTINQFACPSYSLCVQLLWYPMYYPGGMKARVSPVKWSKPYSILAPTRDSNPGGRIQNHKRWPLHYHCTQCSGIYHCTIHPIQSILIHNDWTVKTLLSCNFPFSSQLHIQFKSIFASTYIQYMCLESRYNSWREAGEGTVPANKSATLVHCKYIIQGRGGG